MHTSIVTMWQQKRVFHTHTHLKLVYIQKEKEDELRRLEHELSTEKSKNQEMSQQTVCISIVWQ